MYRVRPAIATDINFVYACWLRSYKDSSPISKFIERKSFFPAYQKILDRILANPDTKVCVACKDDDEDLLYGFIVFAPKLVHFVYVKEDFRRFGIARRLSEQIPDLQDCIATHLTKDLLDLWTAKKTSIQFNPFFISVV